MYINRDKCNLSRDKCNLNRDKCDLSRDKCNLSRDKFILDENCGELVAQLFAEELIPVAAKAQKKVPVPEG